MNPPAFNFRNTPSEWRQIDLRTTMDIAHRCTSGVSYTGCSKAEIIEGVARANGYTSKPEKFLYMMNEAARRIRTIKTEYNRKVYQLLEELASQYESDRKP